MKKQRLQTFIQRNRTHFDQANPPEGLWENISTALDSRQADRQPHRKKYRMGRLIRLAASLLLICVTGFLVYNYGRRQALDDYSRISPELAAEQEIYAQLVLQKRDSIALFATADPVLFGEFSTVFSQMESNYNALKQELIESPNKELTLEAMIHNLQAQIKVLSQQMEVLNYVKKSKNNLRNEQI